jgi:hypothetical protein
LGKLPPEEENDLCWQAGQNIETFLTNSYREREEEEIKE